jgi:glycosyltransferase involved in cell wall biosynthesis
MKVLMTADCVGGVWTYALDLADALAPLGVEVHLATMGRGPDDEQREAAAQSALAALHESGFALEWDDEPWEDVDRAGEWLLDLARTVRPDLVHLNGYGHGALAWGAPVVVVAHSDVLAWWRAVEGTPPPARLDRYRRRVEAGLQGADAVCAPTAAVLDDLAASYRFETPRFVVPNGRARRVRDGEKEQLIAGLGRFSDAAKNVAALRRVAPHLEWEVTLAGPGTERGTVSPAAAADLLARAAIFASPARYEPFGLAALEAAQAGCALVLGDIPSLREVWADAAAYVPPTDDDALLGVLRGLCEDDDRRQELARRARERAERYTPAAMAEATKAVYTRLPVGAAA